MSKTHQLVFYPVGNGDSSQIILADGRRLLFDFCHRSKGEDPDTPEIDLKARLKKELSDATRDHFNVVAFTHADEDHICGSTEFFELLHADKYQGKERVKIKELWVPAAMVVETVERDELSNEFPILRSEARYRILEGKGIRVFSKPKDLQDWLIPELKKRGEPANARDHLFVDAGKLVPGFELKKDGIEFFCHSPFIEHCDGATIVRNDASLIFNVRFDVNGSTSDYLAIGDASWEVLEDIVRKTRKYKNEDRLQWDIYNIAHHCSYKSLSDEKGRDETEPKPLVKDLLLSGKYGSYLVSSSKPIPDTREAYNQDLPPHIQARKAYERYLNEVNGNSFLVTMEEPNANKPEPLVFEISDVGVSWIKTTAVGAASIIASRSLRAGVDD